MRLAVTALEVDHLEQRESHRLVAEHRPMDDDEHRMGVVASSDCHARQKLRGGRQEHRATARLHRTDPTDPDRH